MMWPGRTGSRWPNSGNQRPRHEQPRRPAVVRLQQRSRPKMAPRKVGNNRPMGGVFKVVLIAAGLLCVGTAVAYGQLPEPRAHEFPYAGNRAAVWVVAQLHILFAAFILGAPIFIVVSEILGWLSGENYAARYRYERLAKEVTKVTVILYSMTALTGGLFIFVLLATYPQFTAWLINHFFAVFAIIYPLLFIAETIILYLYWYTWDALQGPKKGRHIALGALLNIIGLATLIVIDGPTAFMNTPAKFAEGGMDLRTFIETTATLWDKTNNYSWWPLNL